MFRHLISRLSEDLLLLILLLAVVPLLWWNPVEWTAIPELVHWHTIAALAGLMVISRGLEVSGSLAAAGAWLLLRLHSERRLALALILFSALLSAIVTNDVALFIVVPLTLGLWVAADLPLVRLIVFEALAVNAGSTLSPVGNPQNLYLWQASGVGFMEFMLAMLPLGLALVFLLVLMVPLAFSSARITVNQTAWQPPIQRGMLLVSLMLYPLFLFMLDWGQGLLAAVGVVLLYLFCWPRILRGVDWQLLLVFCLMFVVLGLLAQMPVLAELTRAAEGRLPGGMLTVGALLSQGISNVPAAIFLQGLTDDWQLLAWGVSVGGFGLAIGSMANIIALRLAREPGLWRSFHAWSLPTLLLAWVLAWALAALLGY
ncbi:Na+/H+ antiporter NhaD/arsenite permease-like protein [Natronospira proteinivora]|uniref:Na+/H+ antiporter NhaD/arsenite permease-like protein n=1 Tax=Natronospira proteinivora TaxID=1807133 RepID=A0ABT1G8L7_9GAMM|nr:SLC13 family permease [Natronospira proteinivora]MCP1727664.1 Na+/H+ antiporter NhaD/arsenite permease-like protein [Natronospira proteinivora]